jgi:hypothetical protein
MVLVLSPLFMHQPLTTNFAQLYPALFERVKEKVLAGSFHPIGGSWVENDANMPSGEALIRQMVFGQRYFESRFGRRCEVAWLPDSFGLTGALPQLIRGTGEFFFLGSVYIVRVIDDWDRVPRYEVLLYPEAVVVSDPFVCLIGYTPINLLAGITCTLPPTFLSFSLPRRY